MLFVKRLVLLAFACTCIAAQPLNRVVTEADCTAASLVASITQTTIGEPVRSVTLQAAWVAATDTVPAHCGIDGVFAPVDTAPTARVINERRRFLSEILDSTSPDFGAFARRGGKMIVAIGTNDTLASPGSQLDLYQSVIDKLGRSQTDRFARLFVMPQTGHGLSGTNYGTSGDGRTLAVAPAPNTWDRLALLFDWVERGVAPGMSMTVTAGEKSLPLCSYPTYPKYVSGSAATAASYRCAQP